MKTLEQYIAEHPNEKVVPMVLPSRVLLTLGDHSQVLILAGRQGIPESLADHWYLKDNGAKREEPIKQPRRPAPRTPTKTSEDGKPPEGEENKDTEPKQ